MAKKYKFDKTVNKLNRHDDTVYKAIGADGSVRLIKYTDRGYIELDINNGSELGSIREEEALKLIPRDQKGVPLQNPLTFEEKTAYVEKFDASQQGTYLDPDQTTLEEITTDTAMNKRLAPAYARASERETGIREAQLAGGEAELDPKYSGESISMAEFNRAKDWEAGRRPIVDDAPTEYLPPLEQTNYSLNRSFTPSVNESADFQQHTGGQTDFSSLDAAMAPGLDQKNLQIGTGGDPGLFEVDDDFYRSKDGTLMKDAGWWGEDTRATQADIDAGITDQNSSSPWGSTAGWEAAGSVMKGVGGLASAYTGIKSYQLAKDAFSTQKNQWQQNYDQRLRAYKKNVALTNQEIDAKNRTLRARNPDRPKTDYYQSI